MEGSPNLEPRSDVNTVQTLSFCTEIAPHGKRLEKGGRGKVAHWLTEDPLKIGYLGTPSQKGAEQRWSHAS